MRAFLSADMLRNSTSLVVAPSNPMGELSYFHHLKQRSSEQNLTRNMTTVELCDGDTNIAVVETIKTRSVSETNKIELIHWINFVL